MQCGAPTLGRERAVHQHHLAHPFLTGVGDIDRHAGADRLTQHRGAPDAQVVHHIDRATCIIGKARLAGNRVGVPMAGIIHRHDTKPRRQRPHQLQHQRRGLLVDMEQHDGLAGTRRPVMNVTGFGRDKSTFNFHLFPPRSSAASYPCVFRQASYRALFSTLGGYSPGSDAPLSTSPMIQVSMCSCSTAAATTPSSSACGITTAPSWSTTTTSSGNTATPPQPIGSCQFTNVSPPTEGGAAAPWHQTGNPVASTPATSRTTPSVTSPATPRCFIRAHNMSPKIPASVMPIASTTAMHPTGIASIAARVDFGEDQDSGVARSSRAGTKRRVKARPTSRG